MTFEERRFYLSLRAALEGRDLVVYDIGAARGVFTGCLAKLTNVSQVHAFEPIGSAYADLIKRTRQFPQVTCHQVAVGDVNAPIDMWVIDDSRDSSSVLNMLDTHKQERPGATYRQHPEQVEMVRLDDYVDQKGLAPPGVVKIDVQGFEDRVLAGGRQTISRSSFCVLEMSFVPLYKNSPLFDDIYSEMRGLGFDLAGLAGELYGRSGRLLQVDGIFERRHSEKRGA